MRAGVVEVDRKCPLAWEKNQRDHPWVQEFRLERENLGREGVAQGGLVGLGAEQEVSPSFG